MNFIFPGSFDPLTLGHLNIIKRIASKGNNVVVVVTHNNKKKPFLDIEIRKSLIIQTLIDNNISNVNVDHHEGIIVDYCSKNNIDVIVRGLRNSSDLMYEQNMYCHNKALNNNVETICLLTDPEYSHISSSDVREIWKFDKQRIRHLVPVCIADYLERGL